MKLSVNILCWNTIKTLKMTLAVLDKELAGIDHEIVIVDNGSKDGTVEYVLGLSRVKPALLNTNHGISIGKNIGVRISKGEYILMLDGDVVPVPNSILKLVEFLDNNPDKDAIGFQPNAFAIDHNTDYDKSRHEEKCEVLFDPQPGQTTCLFYGLYRRTVFDKCMMDESGEYGKVGYGWEDHDFFMQMKSQGITQWVAHMNRKGGKYYHAINSSIRPQCMGYDEYMRTSQIRAKQYREKWEKCLAK